MNWQRKIYLKGEATPELFPRTRDRRTYLLECIQDTHLDFLDRLGGGGGFFVRHGLVVPFNSNS